MDSSFFAAVVLTVVVLPRSVDEWWWMSFGCQRESTTRLFFGAYLLLCCRDYYGCFALNMTKKDWRSVRKPLGYDVQFLRRPRWCPLWFFGVLVAERTQRVAFCFTAAGSAVIAFLLPSSRLLCALVASAATLVELRFHSALGWHRCVLAVWTLWTFALDSSVAPAARVLALAHSYGGSGLSRLRIARPRFSFAEDSRIVLDAGVARSLFPKFVERLTRSSDIELFLSGFFSRVLFELISVFLLLVKLLSPFSFRVAAFLFHLGVAAATSIDFLENKVILLATLFDGAGVSTESHLFDLILARIYGLALLYPVLRLGFEDFPFTHNALFPFSSSQMTKAKIFDHNFTMTASLKDHNVDLTVAFLQSSPTQPAQLWHPAVWNALKLTLSGRPQDAADHLADWLRTQRPLLVYVDNTYKPLDTIAIRRRRRPPPPEKDYSSSSKKKGGLLLATTREQGDWLASA